MESQAHELDGPAMMARIDQLEQRAIHLRLPTAYDSSLYTMRLHIGLLRSHLQSILANDTPTARTTTIVRPPAERGVLAAPPDRQSAE
jgi:hypothetical protein